MRFSATVILATVILFPLPSLHAGTVLFNDAAGSVSLGKHLDILEDRKKVWTIGDVSNGNPSGSFAPSRDDVPNFGYTSSAYWLRFTVREASGRDSRRVLEIAYPLLDDIRLYTPGEGGFTERKAGRNYPFSAKEIPYRCFAFFLPMKSGRDMTCYLRVESKDSLPVPVVLRSQEAFDAKKHHEQLVMGIYYGIIVVMTLYSLFIFITIRDLNYLYYVFSLITINGLFQMGINGYTFEYLGRNSIWWSRTSISFFFSFGAIWVLLFCKTFLDTKKNLPVLDKMFIVAMAWAGVEAVLSLVIDYYYAIQSAVVMGMFSVSCIWLAGFVSLKRGNRAARFYLVAWTAYCLGGTLYSLKVWGFLPSNAVTENSWQVGGAFIAFLLSIALGDRINIMKREQYVTQRKLLEEETIARKAQEELTEKLREMDQLKGEINRRLEEQVRERTAELQQARDALWGEMELAKKLQTVLLPRSPNIPHYRIAAYMEPAAEVGGDYYDIINAGGMDWVVIGDVSGHGVPSGLIMMMVQTSIHVALCQNPQMSPSELLTVINRTIANNMKNLGEDKYMTITVLAAHMEGRFLFSGLHLDMMIYRSQDRRVEIVETSGMWIGLMDDIEGYVEDDSFTLGVGDTLVIYTDGLTEAWRSGTEKDNRDAGTDMFGQDRLVRLVGELGGMQPEDVKEGILRELEGYVRHDDVTLVVLKRIN